MNKLEELRELINKEEFTSEDDYLSNYVNIVYDINSIISELDSNIDNENTKELNETNETEEVLKYAIILAKITNCNKTIMLDLIMHSDYITTFIAIENEFVKEYCEGIVDTAINYVQNLRRINSLYKQHNENDLSDEEIEKRYGCTNVSRRNEK